MFVKLQLSLKDAIRSLIIRLNSFNEGASLTDVGNVFQSFVVEHVNEPVWRAVLVLGRINDLFSDDLKFLLHTSGSYAYFYGKRSLNGYKNQFLLTRNYLRTIVFVHGCMQISVH